MTLNVWRLMPCLLFLVLIVVLWRGLSLDPQQLDSVKENQALPAFKLPILGKSKEFLTEKSLSGQLSLLNVWASWCSACVEEQVFLLQLANQGLPIYGLDYKDKSEDAENWLKRWGNPYRWVAEDKQGQTAIELGVYGAPETFLIDAKGIIRFRHVGILTEAVWRKDFLPRIRTTSCRT